MPKLGRKSDLNDWDFVGNQQHVVNSKAPFGTQDTPVYRVRIIGGKMVNVREDDPDILSSRSRSSSPQKNLNSHRSSSRASPAVRLMPLTEKPTEFNPFAIQHQQTARQMYHSAQGDAYYVQDSHKSQLHDLNPHSRIPPIKEPFLDQPNPSPSGRVGASGLMPLDGSQQISSQYTVDKQAPSKLRTDVLRHLPAVNMPDKPLVYPEFTKSDELELRLRIQRELNANFDMKKLKDIYLSLTGFDLHLEGYVNYRDLAFTLLKFQVQLDPDTLRLVCAQFINPKNTSMVNYEKVLSYIAGSLKEDFSTKQKEQQQNWYKQPQQQQTNDADYRNRFSNVKQPSDVDSLASTAIDNAVDGGQKQRHPKQLGEKDNAKLFRLIEQQLLNADDPVNFESVWRAFREVDRDHRNRLSRDQIKRLTQQCRIPLQESIINQIIDRCESSNGQYNWQQYLNFIERVQPMSTGLEIFPNKPPKDYVKHFPEPTADWPRNQSNEEKPNLHVPPPAPQTKNNGMFQDEYATHASQRQNPNPKGYSHTTQPFELPLSHRRNDQLADLEKKQAETERKDVLQVELDRLHKEYDSVRNAMIRQNGEDQEPWFDRFMNLARALYQNDTDRKGYLSKGEANWLVEKYNDMYNLQIPQKEIDRALQNCMDSGHVMIDPLVKLLGMTGP